MRLITGSGGHLGRLITQKLGEREVPFIAGSRRPQPGQRHLDFDRPETLNLQGITSLLLISAGYGEDDEVIRRHDNMIGAAERDGVQHIVYTSLTGAGDHLAFALAHRWTERRIQTSGLRYTILRNGLYSELIGGLTMPVNGIISTPLGNGQVAAVAREDLADAAVSVFTRPQEHADRIYELVGTQAIGGAEIAEARSAQYRPEPLAAARMKLTVPPLLPFQPTMLLSVFSSIAGGFLGETTDNDLPFLLQRAHRPPLQHL